MEITAVNDLPAVIASRYPQIFVVDTDPLPNPGKHWVCIILMKPSSVEYFDSLGKKTEFYGYGLKSL